MKKQESYFGEDLDKVTINHSFISNSLISIYFYFPSLGKNFATRQTKWDALFMGIQAMGRDEHLISYLFRLLLTMAFNFTFGKLLLFIYFSQFLFIFVIVVVIVVVKE